jgi:hypothetical protein
VGAVQQGPGARVGDERWIHPAQIEHSLHDSRHRPDDGAGRLLVTLARPGLEPRAYRSAAMLAIELDRRAFDDQEIAV